MITSSALVLLMIPGTGLLYSGMSRNSSLSMVWMPTATGIVVGIVVSLSKIRAPQVELTSYSGFSGAMLSPSHHRRMDSGEVLMASYFIMP